MWEKPSAAHEIGTLLKRTWFHVAGLDPATAVVKNSSVLPQAERYYLGLDFGNSARSKDLHCGDQEDLVVVPTRNPVTSTEPETESGRQRHTRGAHGEDNFSQSI
jgi:hypothetical protein